MAHTRPTTLLTLLLLATLAQAFNITSFTMEPSVVNTDNAAALISLTIVYDSMGRNLSSCTVSNAYIIGTFVVKLNICVLYLMTCPNSRHADNVTNFVDSVWDVESSLIQGSKSGVGTLQTYREIKRYSLPVCRCS
jgi:hypothetical protein